MAESFTNSGLPTVYSFIQDDLGLSLTEVGFLSSGMLVGGTATNLLMGLVVDSLGVRRVITVSAVVVAALVLLFSQSQTLLHAVILTVLMGAASSGMVPSCMKGLMEWVKPQSRALARGIQQTSIPLCGIIAALLLPPLAVIFDWRVAVMVLALLVLIAGTVVLVLYRSNPESPYIAVRRSSPLQSLRIVARNRDLWIVALCQGAFSGANVVFTTYLILFLKEELAMTVVVAGVFLAVAQASGLVWRIVWGVVSDVVFHGRRVVALTLMGMLAVASMPLMVWLPSEASPLLVGAVVAIVAGGFHGSPVLHSVLVAELGGPGLTGTAIGLSMIIMKFLSFGIPPLFGFVVDRTDSYDVGWWMMVGVVAAGTIPLALLRPEARRR